MRHKIQQTSDEVLENQEQLSDEQETEQSSASSKKLMILYVLEVLTKYSDQYHKLTQNDIINYIKQDYGMDCERKAISRHLKSLIDHGYNIDTYENNGEGYYLVDLEFPADDIFMIWDALMSSHQIDRSEMMRLIQKFDKYLGDDLRFGTSYYGGITNRYTYPQTFLYSNLKFILTEMAMEKKISFLYNRYGKDKALEPISEAPFVVSPYAVLNVDGKYYLAAAPEYGLEVACYDVGLISQLEHVGFVGEDIREKTGYAKGFDPDKFVSDFIEGYGGAVTDFLVKIENDKIAHVIEAFGEQFKINYIEDDSLILDITCNYDKMYRWAIDHADFAEVLEPAAMRLQIKEFFDLQSWKYR